MFDDHLPALALLLAVLSVFSIGGGPKIMAPLSHDIVSAHHWMTGEALASLYGLSRGMPGPGALILLAGLVGWTVAGIGGAVVAPLALLLPSSLISFVAAPLWQARPGAPWKSTLLRIVGPVSVGQGAAGGIAILHIAHAGHAGFIIAGTAFFARLTGLPALLVLGMGSVAFATIGAR